jgi:DNA-binding transcriptional ArsR family regulator
VEVALTFASIITLRMTTQPELTWDCGTAYDLFISLHVLHHPTEYELRGSWAAGVRSRLATAERETLEAATAFIVAPLNWIYQLPAPKNSEAVLTALAALPPAERLATVTIHPATPDQVRDLLQRVATDGRWHDSDLQTLKAIAAGKPHVPKDLSVMLTAWARAAQFGEELLQALTVYVDVFFGEEENRIAPMLAEALSEAQALAQQLELPALLEELSQGLRYTGEPDVSTLVLGPSFWATPLVVRGKVSDECELMLFGARPSTASLVPGEVVPDALFRALKAMADPTRLRILRYLTAEPLTPSELAQRLRLRPPTVVHHLHTLRLAGLVYLSFEGGDRRYAARSHAVNNCFTTLTTFLHENS